jgi:hypothetical protein
MRKWAAAIRSATRIALALDRPWMAERIWPDYESFESSIHLVFEMLEAANDELKPKLEERARRQGG